jgi:hypothetical protein
LEKGRRQGRRIGYEILKWQEEVIDDVESLLDVIHEGHRWKFGIGERINIINWA